MSREITTALIGLMGTIIYGFVSLSCKIYDLKMEIKELRRAIKEREG